VSSVAQLPLGRPAAKVDGLGRIAVRNDGSEAGELELGPAKTRRPGVGRRPPLRSVYYRRRPSPAQSLMEWTGEHPHREDSSSPVRQVITRGIQHAHRSASRLPRHPCRCGNKVLGGVSTSQRPAVQINVQHPAITRTACLPPSVSVQRAAATIPRYSSRGVVICATRGAGSAALRA
jgi:hypothetical protein